MRGHPQTPVGDVLTALPTKLEVEGRRRRRKEQKGGGGESIICPIDRGQTVGCWLLRNLCISYLASSTQPNLDNIIQHGGISHSQGLAGELEGHWCLHDNAYRDTAQHSERRETQKKGNNL